MAKKTIKKDVRCYYCRKKAKMMMAGHPSCGGDHGTARPTAQPVVRETLRNGRTSFLRALRGRIAKVSTEQPGNVVQAETLEIVDAAIGRYAGE